MIQVKEIVNATVLRHPPLAGIEGNLTYVRFQLPNGDEAFSYAKVIAVAENPDKTKNSYTAYTYKEHGYLIFDSENNLLMIDSFDHNFVDYVSKAKISNEGETFINFYFMEKELVLRFYKTHLKFKHFPKNLIEEKLKASIIQYQNSQILK